eukprot:Nitzschia sp. Nitz4//scaffold11_size288233//192645//195567//NITZ4_000796-RA/size288233-snap-gene-0.31-mRNA-1//1//CDS//3329534140//5257//frame0
MKFRSLLIDYYAEAKILLREVLEAAGQQDTDDSKATNGAVSTWPPVDDIPSMEASTPCEIIHDNNGANLVTVQDTFQSNTDDQAGVSFDYGDLYAHPELLMETYETSGKPWTSPTRMDVTRNEDETNAVRLYSPTPAATSTRCTKTFEEIDSSIAVAPMRDQSWLGRLLVLFFQHTRMKWIQNGYSNHSIAFNGSLSSLKPPPAINMSWYGGLLLDVGITTSALKDEKTGCTFNDVLSNGIRFEMVGCTCRDPKDEHFDDTPRSLGLHALMEQPFPCIERVQQDGEVHKNQILMTAIVAGFCAWKHHSSQLSKPNREPESLKLSSACVKSWDAKTIYQSPPFCEGRHQTCKTVAAAIPTPPQEPKRKATWSTSLPRFSKRANITVKKFDLPVTRETSCQQKESAILRRFGLFERDQTKSPEPQAHDRQPLTASKQQCSQTTGQLQVNDEECTKHETSCTHRQDHSRATVPFEHTVHCATAPLSFSHTNHACVDKTDETSEDRTLHDTGMRDAIEVSKTSIVEARGSADKYDDAELSESAKTMLRALDEGRKLGAPPKLESHATPLDCEGAIPQESKKERKRRRKEEKRLHKQQKKERKRQKRFERDARHHRPTLSPQRDCNDIASDAGPKVPKESSEPKHALSVSEVCPGNTQQCNKQESSSLEAGSCHANGARKGASPVNEIKMLCSEGFVESWGDLIASLASGVEGRFVFVDTNLLDFCGVDIETASWGGIIISRMSELQENGVSGLIRRVVHICAMSRYTTLTVFVVSDGEWGAGILDYTRLQNTTLHQSVQNTTKAAIHLVSQPSLAARLAGTIGESSSPEGTTVSFETMESLVSNQKLAEKLMFLISLVPSMSIGAAVEILHWLEDVGSTLQALLGRNDAIRNALARSYPGNRILLRAVAQISFAVSTPLRSIRSMADTIITPT